MYKRLMLKYFLLNAKVLTSVLICAYKVVEPDPGSLWEYLLPGAEYPPGNIKQKNKTLGGEDEKYGL